METVLYFIALAALFFLMMRFGCGAHVMGHGRHGRHGKDTAPEGRWHPPETDVDPVCGMTVRTDIAKSAVYGGRAYFFCSAEHRDQFEAAPDRYIGAAAGAKTKQVEHSHG